MQNINIISNQHPYSLETATVLKKKLLAKKFTVNDIFNANADLTVVVGGDGSFLRAVHNSKFSSIPFIGINTGNLGFFQEITPDQIDNFIDYLSEDELKYESMFLIEADICTNNQCINLLGINELAIKNVSSRTVHLNVSINDTFLEKFSGDGIVVSTPTGSTAYNYSAGGSIVYPTIDVLQITPISPINSNIYRCLNSSIIAPPNGKIMIVPEYRDENSILISVDGKQYTYDNITEIYLKISDIKINLLKFGNQNFWEKIKEKFL